MSPSELPTSRRNRDAADVKVFPPVVFLVHLGSGMLLDKVAPLPLGLVPWPGALEWLGRCCVGFAMVVLFWTFYVLQRTGQDPSPFKPTPELVESGPFRWSRNPIYLQMLLICIGIGLHDANWWLPVLAPIAVVVFNRWVIRPEERYLLQKFGDAYGGYMGRVRRWF